MLKRSVEACSYTLGLKLKILTDITEVIFDGTHLLRELFPVLEDFVDCHMANYSSLVTLQGRSEQRGREIRLGKRTHPGP